MNASTVWKNYEWPVNLYIDTVLWGDPAELVEGDVPHDLSETFFFAIEKLKSDPDIKWNISRGMDILLDHYQKKKSQTTIATERGMGRENVRQILQKSRRQFKRLSIKDVVKSGLSAYIEPSAQEILSNRSILEFGFGNYFKKRMYARMPEVKTIGDLCACSSEELQKNAILSAMDVRAVEVALSKHGLSLRGGKNIAPKSGTSIDQLGLSSHIHGQLLRHGYSTIEELALLSDEEMRSIRGISWKSILEIKEKLAGLNSSSPSRNVNVFALRASLAMSQKSFAEAIGVSSRMVAEWEAGKSLPSPTAQKLMFLIQEDGSLIQKLRPSC